MQNKSNACILLACGPSLLQQDLKALAQNPCVAISNFFVHELYLQLNIEYHVFGARHEPISEKMYVNWFRDAQKHIPKETKVLVNENERELAQVNNLFQKQTLEYWTFSYDPKVAASYDDDRKLEEMWELEQLFVRAYVSRIPEMARLLDVPEGTGRFLEFYESRHLNVTGIDISEAMLAEAKVKEASKNVEFIASSAHEICSDDNEFEYSISWRFLHLLEIDDILKFLLELARVTEREICLQAYARDLKASIRKRISKILFWQQNKEVVRKENQAIDARKYIKAHNYRERALVKVFRSANLKLLKKRESDFTGELQLMHTFCT